jgi:lysosomal acid lipase/cholesteryl ester hydrolase
MKVAYDFVPSKPFGLLGYQMFAFLFNWTDKNWVCHFLLLNVTEKIHDPFNWQLKRRKPKKFRFTPTQVSSAGIFWWTGYEGFSTRGCVLDPEVEKWWDQKFPPLSMY